MITVICVLNTQCKKLKKNEVKKKIVDKIRDYVSNLTCVIKTHVNNFHFKMKRLFLV